MANLCSLTAWIDLVVKKRNKTTTNNQRKTKEKINKQKLGMVVPIMNHDPRNG